MELLPLSYFQVVARLEHMTRAVDKLNVTQLPSLRRSRQDDMGESACLTGALSWCEWLGVRMPFEPEHPTIQARQVDQSAFAHLHFDSAQHSWRALRLRQLTYLPEFEAGCLPAISEQTMTMLLSGESDVASGIDRRWRGLEPVRALSR